MSTWLVCTAFSVGLPVLAGFALSRQPGPPLEALSREDLLVRAGEYVRRFTQAMSTVLLEERYVQVIKTWSLPPSAPDADQLAWFDELSKVRPNVVVRERRQTRSDVLLVQLPNGLWTAFRDTLEVNGRFQGNQQGRLRALFLEQTDDSRRQLRRINERSADWNLGNFYREINLPSIGLLVVHSTYQPRFSFTLGEIQRDGQTPCRILTFRESARPTLVRSVRERDVPLSGSVCVDAHGVVWTTRIDLDARFTTRGAIEVSYGRNQRLDVLAPERMWEWYQLPEPDREGMPLYVEALAIYSNLRRFTVTTTEQIR